MINIVVNLKVEGLHNWPKVDIPEVMFLKYKHRHIFHIKAKMRVSHEDRDQEIIMLKRSIEEFLKSNYGQPCEFKNMSCESIAVLLVKVFGLNYCEVLEDGENGAEVIL